MVSNNIPTNALTWEYIAGFFDGEGCIFFMKYKNNHVILYIGQGDKNNTPCHVIEDICDFLKGEGIKARFTHYAARSPYSREARVIVSSSASCRDWLIGMLPFLRVKKQKAIETIQLLDTKMKHRWTSPRETKTILELRQQGYGIKRIAKEVSKTHGTVKNVLQANNAYNERFKPGPAVGTHYRLHKK